MSVAISRLTDIQRRRTLDRRAPYSKGIEDMTRAKKLRLIGAAVGGVAAMMAVAAQAPANGYQTWGDHKLTYGVTGQKFWLDSTAANNNNAAIHDGVALWNATKTPISYSETATKASSRMDFYHTSATNVSWCGITYLYVDTTDLTAGGTKAPTRNWWWGKVTLSPLLKNTAACGASGHRKAIVAHEQGHVMGLAHAVNSDRLMYSGIAGTGVNAPISDDVNGINHLY